MTHYISTETQYNLSTFLCFSRFRTVADLEVLKLGQPSLKITQLNSGNATASICHQQFINGISFASRDFYLTGKLPRCFINHSENCSLFKKCIDFWKAQFMYIKFLRYTFSENENSIRFLRNNHKIIMDIEPYRRISEVFCEVSYTHFACYKPMNILFRIMWLFYSYVSE